MVTLGEANSWMRDFFDVSTIAARMKFGGATLMEAVRATFARRGTPPPVESPVALTAAFAEITGKQAQWRAFVGRTQLSAASLDLKEVVADVARFVQPVLAAAARDQMFEATWGAGGPWEMSS